uniref:Uncharacterized protein n=1 Tax=Rhizophora mucronata TaxID=61149 RepID=A0A2P2NCE6_RHIMU
MNFSKKRQTNLVSKIRNLHI